MMIPSMMNSGWLSPSSEVPPRITMDVPSPGDPPDDRRTVLCVGRIAPHKRQDELLRVAALHGALHLNIVGEPLNPPYGERLRRLGDELGVDVTWESGLSTDELAQRYRRAAAFVTLSEHEGFCIPLLEAFHMGVPVIARPSGGIPRPVITICELTSSLSVFRTGPFAAACHTHCSSRKSRFSLAP